MTSHRRTLIALALLVAAPGLAADPGAPLMGPYTTRVDADSGSVSWVTVAGVSPGTVRFTAGSRTGVVKAAVRPFDGRTELLHTARLAGLPTDTPVSWEVRSGLTTIKGGFRTALPQGSRTPFRFIVYGDTRSYPDRHEQVVGGMTKEKDVRFVALSGDLVANGDKWEEWPEQFFGPAKAFLERTAFWPVRGNHEGSAKLYKEFFDLPGNEQWYSFDCGNVHVIGLDSEVKGDEVAAQLDWLKADLAANKADWTLVTYHKPTFNIGGHGSDWGAKDLLPLLEEGGVDIDITGHSHLYERFVPIGRDGKRPIVHIVSGGGGAPLYDVKPSPLLEGGIGYSGLHYCVFDVAGDRLVMEAKKPDGTVFDRMELVKTNGMFQPEVMAKAVNTDEARLKAGTLAGLQADFATGPKAGQWSKVRIVSDKLPLGTRVGVESAKLLSAWKVKDAAPDLAAEGLSFEVRAPKKFTLDGTKLDPPLSLELEIFVNGKKHEIETGPVGVTEATARRLTPAPKKVPVKRATATILVDGDDADWLGQPAHPRRDGKSSPFVLRWSADGLYGLATLDDTELQPRPKDPWRGDAILITVEKDAKRATKDKENPAASSYYISPGTEPGPAVPMYWDTNKETAPPVMAAWKKTETGWIVEFLIPAGLLAPATLKSGTVIGFNAVHLDGGQAKASTWNDWEWHSPFLWGAIKLAE